MELQLRLRMRRKENEQVQKKRLLNRQRDLRKMALKKQKKAKEQGVKKFISKN